MVLAAWPKLPAAPRGQAQGKGEGKVPVKKKSKRKDGSDYDDDENEDELEDVLLDEQDGANQPAAAASSSTVSPILFSSSYAPTVRLFAGAHTSPRLVRLSVVREVARQRQGQAQARSSQARHVRDRGSRGRPSPGNLARAACPARLWGGPLGSGPSSIYPALLPSAWKDGS